MKARPHDDGVFPELMKRIGLTPLHMLTALEQRAIEYAKQSQQQMRTREYARREREKEAAE